MYEVRRFDEPLWHWSVPLLVESSHNVLSRFGIPVGLNSGLSP